MKRYQELLEKQQALHISAAQRQADLLAHVPELVEAPVVSVGFSRDARGRRARAIWRKVDADSTCATLAAEAEAAVTGSSSLDEVSVKTWVGW
jgi:hypothetical protein